MKLARVLLAAALAASPALAQDAPAASADTPLVAGSPGVPVPRRSKFVLPEYPAEAQAQGLRGIVILEVTIDAQGKVTATRVIRSVPPFDAAAATAARQWEYEPVKVGGKAVSVTLTVPITFALKLPDIQRGPGVPEMRQGAAPSVSGQAAEKPAVVTAAVTLDPEGLVSDAQIKAGESPYAESVLNALRTWRFAVIPADGIVTFDVQAEFTPQPGAPPKVALSITGVERNAGTAAESPAPPAAPAAAVAAASGPSVPAAAPAAAQLTPQGEPIPTPPPLGPSPRPGVPVPHTDAMPPAARPAVPAPAPKASPQTANPGPAPVHAGPQVEVIRGATPPAASSGLPAAMPPGPPISSVRDVSLASGVPDLAKGRRPVVPPFARMSGAGGAVDVRFGVDAGGVTSVQDVAGPDVLKDNARQTVLSWGFRRTTLERVYLIATFTYDGSRARATVKPAE